MSPALRWLSAGVAVVLLLSSTPSLSAVEPTRAQRIDHELRGLETLGSVLYIAAHPDDENTQLITYFARGACYRTGYLSLTRGDGGQNLLGPEFGDALGVARTQELLAARAIDGGQQFFTRARDFGYSKDYQQTLTRWDREAVVCDIVRVIRRFRPDIVITRFLPEPTGTHGHHTASAVLALEAFSLAGRPDAFSDKLGSLPPWQPRRLFVNTGTFVPEPTTASSPPLRKDIAGNDPETGEPFSSLAVRSRAMHKTQGFGNFTIGSTSGPKIETFVQLAGDPASHELFEGIDCTWGRVSGGEAVGRAIASIRAAFDPSHPEASVPALLAVRAQLKSLPRDALVDEKSRALDAVLIECLGLSLNVSIPHAEVTPGESVALTEQVALTAPQRVTLLALSYPATGEKEQVGTRLATGQSFSRAARQTLPTTTPLTQPYWLARPGKPGMFEVEDPALIGSPENPPSFPVVASFDVEGQTLEVSTQPYESGPTAGASPHRRPLTVVAPVIVRCVDPVILLAPKGSGALAIDIEAARAGVSGALSLELPAGWTATPSSQPFSLGQVGQHRELRFRVSAPAETGRFVITARADVGGVSYRTGRTSIHYAHIPEQTLLPLAQAKALSIDLKTGGKRIGYLGGAGDSVADCLRAAGFDVRDVSASDLSGASVSAFDAILVGIRAFNTRTDLAKVLPALRAYMEAGGTVVCQYMTPNGLLVPQFAPYPLSLSRDLPKYRVTDENGPVTLLAPDSPAFHRPNLIAAADFSGWVQERGLDFASTWDTGHYQSLIACSDRSEPPLKGGLLIAKVGKGTFVYTGLSFFRQLPAGVPGAYRLMANLLNLGATAP